MSSSVFTGDAPWLPRAAVVHAASPLECEVPPPPEGWEEAPSVARQTNSDKPFEGGSQVSLRNNVPLGIRGGLLREGVEHGCLGGLEVPHVASHDGQAVLEGRRCDEQVRTLVAEGR